MALPRCTRRLCPRPMMWPRCTMTEPIGMPPSAKPALASSIAASMKGSIGELWGGSGQARSREADRLNIDAARLFRLRGGAMVAGARGRLYKRTRGVYSRSDHGRAAGTRTDPEIVVRGE